MGNFNFRKCKIPTTWRLGTLGEISTSFSNQRVPLKSADRKLRQGQYRYFGAQGVIDHIDDYIFDGKYLLVAEDGENVKSRKYDIAFVVEGKFWVNNHAHVLQGNAFGDTDYLRYVLNFVSIKEYVTGQAQPKLNKAQLEKIVITIPPLDEQQKIAEILSTVDKKIDLIDQKIAETEKLKTGLMQKLFSEGVGVQGENGEWQPHTEFSSDLLPSSWEVGEVIDFLELQRGHDLPVQKRMGGSVPIIGSNGIAGYHSQAVVEESGVITGRSGTLGKVYFSEGSFWPLNTSLYIRDFKGNNKKYCFYFLEHFNLKRFGTGTGVPTLNRNIVHKQKTAFPSLIEQEKIAEILDTVSQKKQILEQQKAETQQLKKGLMQKLLTGEWRVPVEETEAA
ncbi:restriction endonuclease subunit S [Vibrio parahaemolyticus]|uniref:restriction endonuclease subunit S n=1 Tax=Vibrio parahaemolyticus TaxID=670 RepID=UPI00111E276F|nr:restriction endonuclease subunit S [Vibrio parahaemolyticus]TOI51475.1 hypothetical protein CGI58_18330 [Vibrio parahaemolyticus]